MRTPGHHWATTLTSLALALTSVACDNLHGTTTLVTNNQDAEEQAWWEHGDGDQTGGDSASDGDDGTGVSPEVCDGLDNDLNGLVDDGLVSVPCTVNGESGMTVCVNGREVCHQCTPGETRQLACSCGIDRHDRCNDAGRWLIGACSGCAEEPPTGCSALTACTPGEHRFVRCDSCLPSATSCGSTCVGREMVCDDNCDWVEISGCAPRNAQCDRDHTTVETCGKCGTRDVKCDGCFFEYGDCQDQGVCWPGDQYSAKCNGQSCASGFYSGIRCDNQCNWVQSNCQGCDVTAGTQRVTTDCVPGANCGTRVVDQGCMAAGTVTTCNGTLIAKGRVTQSVVHDDCSTLPCRPGDTNQVACTTALGECGNRAQGCTNDCTWAAPSGACVARADSCVPGIQTTQQLSCGANTCGATFTRTSTCQANGCGWSTADGGGCPACSAGQPDSMWCTTADGRCGTATRTCSASCTWGGWSPCVANPNSCVPGTQTTQQISCGANTCGATTTETSTCNANGCGWSTSSSGSCPACSAGEAQQGDCTTASGQCGSQSRTCSGACAWGAWSTCTALPGACTPGGSQQQSCTWTCGLPGTQTYTCNGCGWSPSGSCVPNDSSACSPGASEPVGPCGNCPSQTQTRTCNSSCTWVLSQCIPCL